MKLKLPLKIVLLSIVFYSFSTLKITAQVGVGTITPRGALDIASTTQGLIPPQVALTSLNLQAPVVNPQGGVLPNGTLVWNTNTVGTVPNNVSPGLYYWLDTKWISVAGSPGGLDWSIIGNGGIDGGTTGITGTTATQGTHFLGTYDNTNIDIRTNGTHVARVSALGEFFIGALETVLPGDLMNGVSEGNATFPWALNGYTDQNGGGVYGAVTGGSTNFAAVQGEYSGSSTSSSGVRGINFNASSATGTSFVDPMSSVNGSLPDTDPGTYSQGNQFGVFGANPSSTGRVVGGVLGFNFQNGAYGILGYEDSFGTAYGVVSDANFSAYGAKTSTNQASTGVGLGVNGSFLGGHVRGNQYGLITKGDLIGLYTDGSSVSNKGFAVVSENATGNKTTTYASTSTTVDVSTKGTGKLVNGKAFISFKDDYSNIITDDKPIIVTVSPMGESNGVYIAEVTKEGFTVKENNNGTSNVTFYWIAIGEKYDAKEFVIPTDITKKDFDANLDGFLNINEVTKSPNRKTMWWNGSELEFGDSAPTIATEVIKKKVKTAQRYDETKRTPRRKK